MMIPKTIPETGLDRRDFLRKGLAGVGIGAGLDAFTRGTVSGMPAPQRGSGQGPVPIDRKALIELRVLLGGNKVLAPGDSAYARTGLAKNGLYLKIRPAAIVLCHNEQDVVQCVKWCNRYGISPVVRGGGHSYAGFSTTTGLLIDLKAMNTVRVLQGGVAEVGGAAHNRDVRRETKGKSYFLPGGTCLDVGVGGLVLGGGIGYNCRWAGLTSDSLVSTRIVTASGELFEASADRNADLFWACRGGAGGSFGVNTSFTFKLKDVPQKDVTYFRLDLEGADNAVRVFSEFGKLAATGESRINPVARIRAPRKEANGKRQELDVMSRGQFIGSERELRDLLGSYLVLNSNWKMKEMPYWSAAEYFLDDTQPEHSFGDISRYAVKPLSDTAIARQIELLKRFQGGSTDDVGPSLSLWSLGWVGGEVMNKSARTDTAYVHRGMSTLLRPTCSWPNGSGAESVGKELLDLTREMVGLLVPETPNESYQNFPNRLLEDWQQQYYAENLPRLVDIKAKYDKGNLFNNPQSIPTSLSGVCNGQPDRSTIFAVSGENADERENQRTR